MLKRALIAAGVLLGLITAGVVFVAVTGGSDPPQPQQEEKVVDVSAHE